MTPAALARYPFPPLTAIPLHLHNARSTNKHGKVREDGKRPRDSAWASREYDSKKVIADCLKESRNIGIRLPASVVVIDIDPRNGGDKGFEDLCNDLLIDPSDYEDATVITGSGGRHIYLSKPEDVPVRDTLPDYPGVEFKSQGRQVVSAGSRHPNGKHYKWATDTTDTLTLQSCPANLLRLITRPQSNALTSGGQVDAEELGTLLEELDPTEYDSNDKWEPLLMACHHATGGQGRQEFIDWSTSDPKYADDAELIGRRWDSCDDKKEGARTFKTLNRYLREAGKSEFQIRPDDTAEDFAELDSTVDPKEEIFGERDPKEEIFGDEAEDLFDASYEEDESVGPLSELNAQFGCVMVGGKFRIVTKSADDTMGGREFWTYIADRDFRLWLGNRKIERDKEGKKNVANDIKLGDAWLEWPRRKQYSGVVFAPGREVPGKLNLFTGWGLEPSSRGSWDRLNEMVFECVANGNQEVHDYILNWIRFLFQHPERRAEVAVVMQGGKGVGKGTLAKTILECAGRHGLSAASPDLITGRFNSHLQDVLFLFADEAIRSSDKVAESRLKNMITEPALAFERKGLDVVSGLNYLHIMMATNEKWAIPASIDERRFLMTAVNSKWFGKRDKWDALYEELEGNGNSGYRRFLFDMLNHKLDEKWHPRLVPNTGALLEQKLQTLTPFEFWLFQMANTQTWPFPHIEDKARVFHSDFTNAFVMYCREHGFARSGYSTRNVLNELRDFMPGVATHFRDRVPEDRPDVPMTPSDGRAATLELPTFKALRAHFEKALNQPVSWDAPLAVNPEDDFDFG